MLALANWVLTVFAWHTYSHADKASVTTNEISGHVQAKMVM